MFFTDASWKATIKLSTRFHLPYERWNVIGLARRAPVFLLCPNDDRDAEPDAVAYLVSEGTHLLHLLSGDWTNTPRVHALDWNKLISVEEIWTYRPRRAGADLYAYKDKSGCLRPFDPSWSNEISEPEIKCVWSRENGIASLPQGVSTTSV